MRALYQHSLAVATQLTLLSDDDRVRLNAAKWIAGEAEKSGKVAEEARKFRKEELSKLEEILTRTASDFEAAAGDTSPANRAAEFLEEIRQAPPIEAEVPKPLAPQVRYVERLVSKPGHFPPQFVKVAVGKTEGSGA
jgi:hypothetical protein